MSYFGITDQHDVVFWRSGDCDCELVDVAIVDVEKNVFRRLKQNALL